MLGDGDAGRPVHPHSRYAADATADRDCDVNERIWRVYEPE